MGLKVTTIGDAFTKKVYFINAKTLCALLI